MSDTSDGELKGVNELRKTIAIVAPTMCESYYLLLINQGLNNLPAMPPQIQKTFGTLELSDTQQLVELNRIQYKSPDLL